MRARRIGKVLLLVISSAVSLLLCEGIVRLAHLAPQVERINPGVKESPYRLSENPILGYVYKENYRGREGGLLPIPYVNAHGFQDVERAHAKRPGCRRIIVLGDSVVACRKLPQVLEELLRPADIEVLNFGINGYCTRAEVELLKERGLKFSPDLVLVVFVDNDYYNINADIGWAAERLSAPVEAAFLHSHLFRLASLRWNWWGLRQRMGINAFAGAWVGDLPERRQSVRAVKESAEAGQEFLKDHLLALGNDNVADGLALLKALAVRQGFEVLLAVWPTFEGNQILDYETAEVGKRVLLPEDQMLRVEQLAASQGLKCVRLSPYFREDARRVVQQGQLNCASLQAYYTEDGMHPLPAGNRVAALALKQLISEHSRLLEPRKASPAP